MTGKSESGSFPTRDTTSEQIRNFLKEFLSTTIVSIDEAKALEIADRWPHEATGVQLWTFSLQSYRNIFGKANGMLFWSYIHSVTEDDKNVISQAMKHQPTVIERNIVIGILLFMALFVGLVATLQSHLTNIATLLCAFFLGLASYQWFYSEVTSRDEYI